jgi:hypothetical protein
MVQAYHPTTFLERGVAVPFTTPMLAGTRARPAQRGGTELIVPNPAGGRGVYILPWGGVCQLCRPTVHDTRLNQAVAALRTVTPATIRQAAREVAAEGLAGQDARAAADTAVATEYQDRLLTNFLLLLALVEQVDPAGLGSVPANRARTAELELRAKRTVAGIAPKLGRPVDAIATGLEELAAVLAGIGVSGQSPPPRIPRLLEALRRVREDAGTWAREHGDDSGAQAQMAAAVADLTIACAEKTLTEAHGLIGDMAGLLREWGAAPDKLSQRVSRPEWLLDGWEQICLIWHCADGDVARRAALAEMALLVPVLPKEASDWVGMKIDDDMVMRFRKTVSLNQDWRTGAQFERIERNEKLRALAA